MVQLLSLYKPVKKTVPRSHVLPVVGPGLARLRRRADGAGIRKSLVQLPQGPVHISTSMIGQDGKNLGKLILVHDMSFIERRSADTKK